MPMRAIVWGTLHVGDNRGALTQADDKQTATGTSLVVGAFAFLSVLFSSVRRINEISAKPELV